MSAVAVLSNAAPAPIGPYSQAVRADNMLFCSGQIPIDPATGELVDADNIEAQTQQVMKNLGEVLAAAGADFSHVVKTTIYLINMGDFARVNAIYAKSFGAVPPARATVAVSGLPKGALVEIEAIAMLG